MARIEGKTRIFSSGHLWYSIICKSGRGWTDEFATTVSSPSSVQEAQVSASISVCSTLSATYLSFTSMLAGGDNMWL